MRLGEPQNFNVMTSQGVAEIEGNEILDLPDFCCRLFVHRAEEMGLERWSVSEYYTGRSFLKSGIKDRDQIIAEVIDGFKRSMSPEFMNNYNDQIGGDQIIMRGMVYPVINR